MMTKTPEQRAIDFANWLADQLHAVADSKGVEVGQVIEGLLLLGLNEAMAQAQSGKRLEEAGVETEDVVFGLDLTLKQRSFFLDLAAKANLSTEALCKIAEDITTFDELDEAFTDLKKRARKGGKETGDDGGKLPRKPKPFTCPKCQKKHGPSASWKGTAEAYGQWLEETYGDTFCYPHRPKQ